MVRGNFTRSTLFSRAAVAAAGVAAVLVVAGCMGITFNREQVVHDPPVVKVDPEAPPDRDDATRGYPPGDGVLEQEGVVTVPRGVAQDVYYPVPYISPPNLTVDSPFQNCVVISQKADHFRVQNASGNSTPLDAHWRAKGIKVLLTAAPVTTAVPQLPPPDPVPVPAKP